MNNVSSLLTNAFDPQAKLLSETRGLVNKWQKTGLLEGIKGDTEKSGIAVCLENQARELIKEASTTGTSENSEQWAGVALPLVRRIFTEISAKEFVSVQPMNLPSGLVFYLDFKYGTDQAGKPRFIGNGLGESVFGGTGTKLGSTDSAVNGLYGRHRYGYSMNDQVASFDVVSVATASFEDVKFTPELSASVAAGDYSKITVNVTSSGADLDASKAFTISGSAITDYVPFLTSTDASTGEVSFIVNDGGDRTQTTVDLEYHVQPTDQSRGDFEDNLGPSDATDTGLNKDIGIPEMNIDVKSEPIVAKTRKLKAVWTPELAQDLNAYHSIDAEAELTSLLSEYISAEIDLEILDMLLTRTPAETTGY
jgi:hypothetical protein